MLLLNIPILCEPLVRIELTTSSLPRKCSTPELQRLLNRQQAIVQCTSEQTNYSLAIAMSERPGSNWPPEAWKATALPNELLSQKLSLLPNNTIKGQTQTFDTNKELFRTISL